MTLLRVIAVSVALVVPLTAWADEQDQEGRSVENPTRKAIGDGAFSALTMPARVGGTPAFAWGLGGYDSSRKGPIVDSTAEVRVWGPVALRGGATYSDGTKRMRPSIGGRIQLLRQDAHGVDGALSVFYKAEGFTEAEGEIETFASIGRTFDQVSAIGSLVYGQDPEGNERDGEVRVTVFHVGGGGRFSFGLDSRTRFAIGTQHGKAAIIEPTFDATGGPIGTVTLGPLALFGGVGPSAFKLGGTTRVGVGAFGGLGAAF